MFLSCISNNLVTFIQCCRYHCISWEFAKRTLGTLIPPFRKIYINSVNNMVQAYNPSILEKGRMPSRRVRQAYEFQEEAQSPPPGGGLKIPIHVDEEEGVNPDTQFDHDEILYMRGLEEVESLGLMDIGNLASWEISSFKQGCDLSMLRDESPHTYWQSDDAQPHSLIIRFTKSMNIERISLFLNYPLDESYTPDRIAILAGTGEHDLLEVTKVEFVEPIGWQHIVFNEVSKNGLLKCFILKILFLSNHQNGKDCHVRGLKVLSPGMKSKSRLRNDGNLQDCVGFTSIKFISQSSIR